MSRIDYFYFLVDVSNSMNGRRIGTVNDALNNIIYRLKKMMRNQGVNAKIIMMTFSNSANWSNVMPESVDSFIFEDLVVKNIASNIGNAMEELDAKLSRQAEVRGEEDYVTTIVLFSDGLSTDSYEEGIKRLNNNSLFVSSNRIGVTFNSELSIDISEKFFEKFCNRESNIIKDDFVKLNQAIFDRYR